MSNDLYFLPEAIKPEGFVYPDSYRDFVSKKANGAAFIGMPPWVFASNEYWAMEESESVFGRKLVPFAQAENMDMIAYFLVDGTVDPAVWVANPWAESIYEKCENFSSWIKYASGVSDSLLKENPQFREKKFWFPVG